MDLTHLGGFPPPTVFPPRDPPIHYRRIRILDREDIWQLYYLITTYIRDRSLTDSVTEFAFNTKPWFRQITRSMTKPYQPMVDELVHGEIEDHVRGMGLKEETTEAMVRSLRTWREGGGQLILAGEWNKQMGEFAHTATAILLSLCPNIEKLYLGHVLPNSWLGEYLLKSNYGLLPHPCLQKVKRVETVPEDDLLDDERYYGVVEVLDHIRFFHRLPEMQNFTMQGVQEYQANRRSFVPGTSGIKKICLQRCDMSSSFIGVIIRIPKALEELHLSLGGLDSVDGGFPMVFAHTLGKALHDQKESLRVLDMDFAGANVQYGRSKAYEEPDPRPIRRRDREEDEYFDLDKAISDRPLWLFDVPETRKYGYTIGSLHDFLSLTHLSIPIRELLGPGDDNAGGPPFRLFEQPPFRLIEALPPSLEYLCLYGYVRGQNPEVDEHIDELMKKKEERLPLLREVKGIEETAPDTEMLYEQSYGQETAYWEKPAQDLSWLKE